MTQSKPPPGAAFEAFVSKLGWTIENDVVVVPPNPDNQIQSTVVHESITLPRTLPLSTPPHLLADSLAQSWSRLLHIQPGQRNRSTFTAIQYHALDVAREKSNQNKWTICNLSPTIYQTVEIYARWGNHDELFVALRLVHDM